MRNSILLLTALSACADRVAVEAETPEKDPSYAWQKALKDVGHKDGIDIEALKKAAPELDRYLAWAREHGQHSDNWRESKEDKRLSFLLNVHNAAVLHNLLRHGVPASPDEVQVGLYRWDQAGFYWGSKYKVDGEWSAIRHLSIHDTVSRYQEPLLWVALHDGTQDSAPLKWWPRKKLQTHLKAAMKRLINSDRGLRKDGEDWKANPLFIDRKEDFLFWSEAEDICDWMSSYAKGERKQWLQAQIGACNLESRAPERNTDVRRASDTGPKR
jgi:hypothetical protein